MSPVLQEVSIPIWDNADCDAAYADNKVFDKNLCAGDRQGGKDSCQVSACYFLMNLYIYMNFLR